MERQEPAEIQDLTPEGWESAPSIGDLKQNLTDSKSSHDTQTGKIRNWLDNLHIEGSAKPKKITGHSELQPKLIRKQAEWRYASLSEPFLAAQDLFTIEPVTWEDVEPARQNSLVLNHQINTKMDKVEFVDEFVRAAVDEGTAIIKLGWEFEEGTRVKTQPVVELQPNPQMGQLHQELHAMMQENPTGYESEVPEELRIAHEATMAQGIPYQATILGYEEVEETYTIKNQPSLEICDYRNVIVDPSCRGKLDDAEFIIHRFETSLSNLKRAGRYQNLDSINVSGSSPLGDPDFDTESPTEADPNFNFDDEPRKRLVAYEYWGYWDIDDSGVVTPIVVTWVGDVIIRIEEAPFPDRKLPFVFISTLPVRGSVYGEPDGELLEDNQKIIGAVTRGMIDIMGKSASGQMGVRKDALDAVNRRRFQQGKDYEYNGNVDPRLAFHMHTYPEIPQSAQFMLQQQELDAESMTGVKAFSQGINGSSLGDVATGIRGAIDAAGKRETGILRRLAAGMTKVGRKIIAMNSEFLDDEEIIRITNEQFVAIRRDDLLGNFDLRMDISTAEEDNIKAQELAFMLQTMGNSMDIGITKIILRDIARLRKMPELAKEIQSFEPQPDPIAQQMQLLELQKLEAEVAEIQSKTQENMTDAQLNMAKAREASSKADMTDLNFVEQESGTTQEREKELQGEQAAANLERDVINHQIDAEKERQTELQKYLSGSSA
jgi:hypothetical protein